MLGICSSNHICTMVGGSIVVLIQISLVSMMRQPLVNKYKSSINQFCIYLVAIKLFVGLVNTHVILFYSIILFLSVLKFLPLEMKITGRVSCHNVQRFRFSILISMAVLFVVKQIYARAFLDTRTLAVACRFVFIQRANETD